MNALEQHIRDIISKQGPLSVAAYMELALQHSDYGYYRQNDPLGCEGDFITAPEISQMFGEMIGLWCADVWQQMGKPEKFTLLECGPGRGTLMQDALRATAKIRGFHDAMDLCLIESNASLRKIQEQKLLDFLPRYMNGLDELSSYPVIIIANEFFDALPIRQFEKTKQGWCEHMVTVQNDKLCLTLSQPDPTSSFIPSSMHEAKVGSIYEMSPASLHIMRDMTRHFVSRSGAALVIDYGYTDYAGAATLQAVAKHDYTDIFDRPGEVDLTAHVDFSILKMVAEKQGAHVSEIVGQGEFLRTLGIDLRAMQLKAHADGAQIRNIDGALHRLTDASQMGILFKVMAVSSPQLTKIPGF